MDQQREPTVEESIKEVMQTLPPPIRQYLGEGKYSIVAKNLMRKYGLHIDQGGVLEREIMLLLMGIENPDEFATSLKSEAALSEDAVRKIMTDVNQEIFIPLQKEMRNAGNGARETKSAAPRTSPSIPRSVPFPTSRPPVLSNSAPLPPKMAMPQSKVVPAVPPLSMLPLGEEQKERISNIAPHPSAPPPANLPGAFPPSVAPSIKRPAPPQPFRPTTPVAPAKPYSTDPYREPIDEPVTE
ncbi:MAG: hypothetical protein ACYCPH_02910 [Minisyncoccota bacterium]